MTESFFEKASRLVDPKIKEILGLFVERERKELVNYQITTGGKRFRPALAVASCLACQGKIKDSLYVAAALEILHNCTLIYDDIIDRSVLRRGKPTLWFKYGKSMAECVGVSYAAAIFQAANRSPYPQEIAELFAKTMKIIIEGEILDILFEQSGREEEKYVTKNRYKKVDKADYLRMISKKTASLTEACCEAGAVCAAASPKEKEVLKRYGFNLGLAFQIRDDILDIFGQEKKFGKKIGKDIEEKKMGNIVVVYTLQELASGQDRQNLLTLFKKSRVYKKDIERALKIINKTKAKERSLALEEKHIKKAKGSLLSLPAGKWNSFLAKLADFVIEREK